MQKDSRILIKLQKRKPLALPRTPIRRMPYLTRPHAAKVMRDLGCGRCVGQVADEDYESVFFGGVFGDDRFGFVFSYDGDGG